MQSPSFDVCFFIPKELEKERLAAEERSSQSGNHVEQLETLESLLAEERRAVQLLRDQLDQAKVHIMPVCFCFFFFLEC